MARRISGTSQEWQLRGLGLLVILALLTPGIIKKYEEHGIRKAVEQAHIECVEEYNTSVSTDKYHKAIEAYVLRNGINAGEFSQEDLLKYAQETMDECMEQKVGWVWKDEPSKKKDLVPKVQFESNED